VVTTAGGSNAANTLYSYDGGQTITFTSTAPTSATVGGTAYRVAAIGGASGNPVIFTIDRSSTVGACSISGAVVSFTGPGQCVIDANQAGNADYKPAPQVQQTVQVVKAVLQLALSTNSTSPWLGSPVTFIVVLSGGDAPTGTVAFSDGPTLLGTAPLSGHTATLTVSSLRSGANTITATYSGDARNASATAPALIINVNSRPNPAANPDVIGQVASEIATATRFAQTQLDNTNHRLEEIHDEQDPDNSAGGTTLVAPPARNSTADLSASGVGAPVVGAATPYGDLGGAVGLAGGGVGASEGLSAGASTASAQQPVNGRVPVLGDPGAGASASNPLLAYTPVYPDDTPAQQSAQGRAISALGAALPGAFTALNKSMDLPFHLWSAGVFDFGDLQTNGSYSNHFTTSGVTIGADRKLSNGLTLGLAIGGGIDYNALGTDGTDSSAVSYGATAYASYALAPHTFVDVNASYALIRFALNRQSSDGDTMLKGERQGSDAFGSLTVTQDVKLANWKLSPYGRLEAIDIHLNPYSEKGSSVWALSYNSVESASVNGVVGARIGYPIAMGWGTLSPMARLEYSHAFGGGYSQSLAYASLPTSNYTIDGEPLVSDLYTVGLMLKAEVANELSLDLEYSFSGSGPKFEGQQIRAVVSHAF
jgi:outer membrane autotransporter protein